jgi:Flp pilus assembly protein TadG
MKPRLRRLTDLGAVGKPKMLKYSWLYHRRAIRRFHGNVGEQGSQLAEFGLVAILLFTFMFGIIDFGRALYTYHFVCEAAREATRFAIVRGSSCSSLTSPCAGVSKACPASQADVQNYVRNCVTPSGIDPNSVSVTGPGGQLMWPGTSAPGAAFVCNKGTGNNSSGCEVQVQVTYPYKFMLPLLPAGTLTMTGTSAMVISQ